MKARSVMLAAAATTTLWLASCGTSGDDGATCESQLAAIERLEAEGGKQSELILAYAEFSNTCHGNARTAELRFRRAELLAQNGKIAEAQAALRDIHDHHKEFKDRALCAFLVAFLYDQAGDREQALKTYEQVLELHPGTQEARWAQEALGALDLTGVDFHGSLPFDEKP